MSGRKSKTVPGLVIAAVLAAAGIYFSTTTKVPDVVGMKADEARVQVSEAGLYIQENEPEYSDEIRKDRILYLENAGKRVKKASTVKMTVSMGAEISMYNLVGLSQAEAEQKLGDSGLAMKFKTDYSDEYEAGIVMAQSVKEGKTIYEEEKVVVTVSKGAKPFELAQYKGKDIEDVEKEAERLGLELEIEKKHDSDVKKGDVISQSPKAGTEVKKGDKVKLVVSKGPEQVKVPDLSGMTRSEAEKALKKAGFKVGRVTAQYSNSVAKGKVISQEVKGGKKTDKGSAIDFVISDGKKPAYTPPKNTGGGGGGGGGNPTDISPKPTDISSEPTEI